VGAWPSRREARLRREYAAWYPTLTVTSWVTASTVARRVARQLTGEEPSWGPRWKPGPRILDERHFLFRGGADRDSICRTRLTDEHAQERSAASGGQSPFPQDKADEQGHGT
jgi:hypothetical protein